MSIGSLRLALAGLVLAAAPPAGAAVPQARDEGRALFDALRRPVPEAEALGDDPTPAAIARARYRLAARAYNHTLDRILNPGLGGSGGIDLDAGERLFRWSARCLDAVVDSRERDADRLSAIDEELAYLRRLEATLRPISERPASTFPPSEMVKLEFYRLQMLDRKNQIRGK